MNRRASLLERSAPPACSASACCFSACRSTSRRCDPAQAELAAQRDAAERLRSRGPCRRYRAITAPKNCERFYGCFPRRERSASELEARLRARARRKLRAHAGRVPPGEARRGARRLPRHAAGARQLRAGALVRRRGAARRCRSPRSMRCASSARKSPTTQLEAQVRLTLYFQPGNDLDKGDRHETRLRFLSLRAGRARGLRHARRLRGGSRRGRAPAVDAGRSEEALAAAREGVQATTRPTIRAQRVLPLARAAWWRNGWRRRRRCGSPASPSSAEALYRRVQKHDTGNVRAQAGLAQLEADRRHRLIVAAAEKLVKEEQIPRGPGRRCARCWPRIPQHREAQRLQRRIDERARRSRRSPRRS